MSSRLIREGETLKITAVFFDGDIGLIGKKFKAKEQEVNYIFRRSPRGYFAKRVLGQNGEIYFGVKVRRANPGKTCACKAYPFPHRLNSGKCEEF